MTPNKRVIVNADDFGQSAGVNRGIIEAHEHGIVTSASLMVRWPAAPEAAEYARTHPRLSVGLHLDLGEWVYRNGEWIRLYQVVDEDDPEAVANEVAAQLAMFQTLVGRNPTHIDSHQHSHRREPARSIVSKTAASLAIPVRSFSNEIHYCGDFYGQTDEGVAYPEGISVETLIHMLQGLRPGFTEIGCHPGYGEDLDTMYRSEREHEIKTLCNPQLLNSLPHLGIELATFASRMS